MGEGRAWCWLGMKVVGEVMGGALGKAIGGAMGGVLSGAPNRGDGI